MLTQRGSRPPFALLFDTALILAAASMAIGVILEPTLESGSRVIMCVLLTFAIVATLYLASAPRQLVKFIDRSSDSLEGLVTSIGRRRVPAAIALASALSLYFELLLVRWQASCFQLFAYYKNVTLIACFLGLGIGFALGSRRRLWLAVTIPAVAGQIGLLRILRDTPIAGLLNNPVPENLALGLDDNRLVAVASDALPGLLISYGFLVLVFLATALTMVPFGQFTARLMKRLPDLSAYGWNLLGSITGVVVFTALAHLWAPPSVWLLVGVLAMLPFVAVARVQLIAALAASLVAFVLLSGAHLWSGVQDVYSPYQILSLKATQGGTPVLMVNHTYFQRALDLSAERIAEQPGLEVRARYYELTFLIKPDAERVLVLGSGLGNDVAAALRRGVKHVDAVEIDPAIYRFGQEIHPERPYANPGVTTSITDARRFIRRHDLDFDIIIFGLLDSHSLLSANTSVRLDSFVYTVESFREARLRLAEDGILALSFSLLSQEQGEKLFEMLKIAFDGQPPSVLLSGYDRGFTFLTGPGLSGVDPSIVSGFQDVTSVFHNRATTTDPATDDWPFFYMPRRSMPIGYGALIVILLAATWVLAGRVLQRPGYLVTSLPCFFLGAGFMLIETRSITELGLLYGSTWQVVSVTVIAVLVMAYLANLVILRKGCPPPVVTYGLLLASLILGIAAGAWFFGGGGDAELLVRTLIITLPLFFSGFAFSSELRRSGDVAGVLSSNLLGAVFGGFLEYASMRFGFHSLYVIGAVIYLFAFVSSVRPSWIGSGRIQ
jgi:SAM-dependent methyltransferase